MKRDDDVGFGVVQRDAAKPAAARRIRRYDSRAIHIRDIERRRVHHGRINDQRRGQDPRLKPQRILLG